MIHGTFNCNSAGKGYFRFTKGGIFKVIYLLSNAKDHTALSCINMNSQQRLKYSCQIYFWPWPEFQNHKVRTSFEMIIGLAYIHVCLISNIIK